MVQPMPTGDVVPAPKDKGGRPPTFDRAACLDKICDELEKGTPMTVICAAPGMPTPRQIQNWARDHEEVASRIARARLLGEEAILDSTFAIADDLTEDPASRKVRVWQRFEALKRFNPKRWGDQSATAPTVNVGLAVKVVTDEQIREAQARKKASVLRRLRRNADIAGSPESQQCPVVSDSCTSSQDRAEPDAPPTLGA